MAIVCPNKLAIQCQFVYSTLLVLIILYFYQFIRIMNWSQYSLRPSDAQNGQVRRKKISARNSGISFFISFCSSLPQSLLARVSDSVKDFITPSWLNNLWNNPNDDDGEGSSRSSTPELPQPDGHVAGTPNFMPSAVATSTPDINLRTGKEALSMPGPSRMETTPIVQLREDVVRDGGGRNVGNEPDDDVVIIEEEQPSTSTGVRHTPLPFRNYANPIGTSTPNEDMQLLGGRKQVIDKGKLQCKKNILFCLQKLF